MDIFDNDILKTFNTADVWLDVKAVARLKGISKRAVRLSLKKKNKDGQNRYNYQEVQARGGRSYKIELASLEQDFQKKYIKEYYGELKVANGIIELHNFQPAAEMVISNKQKNLALAKYDLINFWDKYRAEEKSRNIPKRISDKTFLETYNTGILYPQIFAILNTIGIGSLYTWKKIIENNKNWTALVGNYNYSSTKQYRTKLKEEEITVFLKILLSPNRFSIGKAISLTRHILKEKGVESVPKEVTFRRYAKWYKSSNYDKWVLAREGAKALKDKVEPYIVRDTSVLEAGQVLVADGHTLNFQVINPFTGKPTRATLLGFLDWKSGGLVGYEIMLEECTQNIASALRNAILNMDFIPQFVYQDNGRAFKSKFFKGDSKGLVGGVKRARSEADFSPLSPIRFEELGFTGIYEKLGVTPIYATPYNARAKVIERFFLDFQEGFEKLMPSYIGTSIENKPAYLSRNEKLHKQIHQEKASLLVGGVKRARSKADFSPLPPIRFIPTIEQALVLIKEWLKFKHSQPCPNVEGKTIQEVLDTIPKQKINEGELDDLMMAQEIKNISRNGIRFLKADYFNDELYGIREKAIIKYNLNDLSYIKVYSIRGEFLCRADRVTATHPLAQYLGDIKDIEDYKQKITKQNHLRNKTIKAVKEHFALGVSEKLLKSSFFDFSETTLADVKSRAKPRFCPALTLDEEDIDFIKGKLIEAETELVVEIPQIEIEQKTKAKKEKPPENYVENRKRPLFKNNYERYEWHQKNGAICNEDRDWLREYMKSQEYKDLYSETSEWDKNEVLNPRARELQRAERSYAQ